MTTIHNAFDRQSVLMRVGDRVIAVSEAVRAQMAARGIPEGKLRVVRNGTIGGGRRPLYPAETADLSRPAIATVAGLHDRKGIAHLIAAFDAVHRVRPDAHLYIVGEGPERARYEALAAGQGSAAHIHFLGHLDDPRSVLAATDIFALASLQDPFPLVLGEARQMGCAIVSTAVDGIPEALWHGAKGVLVPPADPAALADALVALLNDEPRRAALAAAAAADTDDITVARMSRDTVAVYEDVLRRDARTPKPASGASGTPARSSRGRPDEGPRTGRPDRRNRRAQASRTDAHTQPPGPGGPPPASLVAPAAAAEPSRYLLGPEDHLTLKVWDLRNGDPYQWLALSGEFVVGADGTVSLPIVGEIKAQGLSTGDLAVEIGGALQAKVGLAIKPDASVQILKYRPFYVLGAVQRPGRYDYQPGLTVLQAVSTAQGLIRAEGTDLATFQRQAIEGRGDMRVLDAERNALLARQARLAAEVANAASVAYPAALSQQTSDPLVAQAMREENLLFSAERDALQTQITAIEQSKSVIRTEITSLAAKDVSLNHQLDLTRKDLSQVSDLVSKGIAVMPRQLAAEQSVATYESSKLDVQIASSKAQQDLAQADRDIVELRAKFRTAMATEASDVRARLDANTQRMLTARGLVRQAETAAPGLTGSGEEPNPIYAVIRASDGATVPAQENDLVNPGDVVRVSLPLSSGSTGPAESGPAQRRASADDPYGIAGRPVTARAHRRLAALAAAAAARRPDARGSCVRLDAGR